MRPDASSDIPDSTERPPYLSIHIGPFLFRSYIPVCAPLYLGTQKPTQKAYQIFPKNYHFTTKIGHFP